MAAVSSMNLRRLARTVVHRVLMPRWWELILERKLTALRDEKFIQLFSEELSPEEFTRRFHEQARLRFFFHPRNQKDFFLQLLTRTQPMEEILSEADDMVRKRFQALGSDVVDLGESINWQRDFKSGREWPVRRLSQKEVLDLGQNSDVKVPWELSRFHQVWWLGKAYWLTGSEEYPRKFAELVEDWIKHNPPGQGVNWANAMEPSIRVANWIAGYYFFCTSRSIPDSFWLAFLKSLYAHGVFIRSHLEYSVFSNNHYLADLAGLLFLGIFFSDASFGKRWLRQAVRELEEQMMIQVHEDGVDYEKSVGYHGFVLETLAACALLCKRNRVALSPRFFERLEKMFEFTLHYTRPDGSVPLVGDSDDGRLFRIGMKYDPHNHRGLLLIGGLMFQRADFVRAAAEFHQEALWYFGGEGFELYQRLRGEAPMLSSTAFPHGGFYILRSKDAHVFVDVGPLGRTKTRGHGHNDTLSFELWADGFPLIVDSGTFTYTTDPERRNAFRSTRAHNTVMVDRQELADFSGLWSVKKDHTAPIILEWTSSDEKDILTAQHHAYRRLSAPVLHRRGFELRKSPFALFLSDRFEGESVHQVESFLHFHPSVRLSPAGPRKALASIGNSRYIIEVSLGDLTFLDEWYSERYGVRERNAVLCITLQQQLPVSLEVVIQR